ncbi:unnamed protein product, partial [Ixodes persulcatus]
MALASVVISTSVKISPLSAWMAVRYTSLVFSIPVRAAMLVGAASLTLVSALSDSYSSHSEPSLSLAAMFCFSSSEAARSYSSLYILSLVSRTKDSRAFLAWSLANLALSLLSRSDSLNADITTYFLIDSAICSEVGGVRSSSFNSKLMGSFTGTTLRVLTVSFIAATASLSVLGSSLEVSEWSKMPTWFPLGAPSLSALGGSSVPLENNFPSVLPSLESVDSRFSAGGGTTSSTVFSKAASTYPR